MVLDLIHETTVETGLKPVLKMAPKTMLRSALKRAPVISRAPQGPTQVARPKEPGPGFYLRSGQTYAQAKYSIAKTPVAIRKRRPHLPRCGLV